VAVSLQNDEHHDRQDNSNNCNDNTESDPNDGVGSDSTYGRCSGRLCLGT
jgi:hypothetical protein